MTPDAATNIIDLRFLGYEGLVSTGVLMGPEGISLIDPGPASTAGALEEGLRRLGASIQDVHAVLVTHIHLDHAGGTGALVAAKPDMLVFVHERGARHMVDPSRLLDSASRLYGSEMERLWGDIRPVPEGNVRALRGGEQLPIGGGVEVAYTPGHASHHVSYFHRASGMAFVGDTGGILIPGSRHVLPPTPPPDIDVEAWAESVDRIRAWKPRRLFLTHFGAVEEADEHLSAMVTELEAMSTLARDVLAGGGTEAEQETRFVSAMVRRLRSRMPEEEAARYEKAVPLAHCWMGLARYWTRRTLAGRT
jgi:glyoxylase-like metal-dependent hydrolase (beta-lactamase superfamily II)